MGATVDVGVAFGVAVAAAGRAVAGVAVAAAVARATTPDVAVGSGNCVAEPERSEPLAGSDIAGTVLELPFQTTATLPRINTAAPIKIKGKAKLLVGDLLGWLIGESPT